MRGNSLAIGEIPRVARRAGEGGVFAGRKGRVCGVSRRSGVRPGTRRVGRVRFRRLVPHPRPGVEMKGPRPAHANRDPVRRCDVTAQRHRESRVRGSRPLAHQTRSPCPQIASPARQPQTVAVVRVVGRVGRRRPCSRCSAPLVGSCGPRRRKLRRTGFRPGRTPDLRLTPQTRPLPRRTRLPHPHAARRGESHLLPGCCRA